MKTRNLLSLVVAASPLVALAQAPAAPQPAKPATAPATAPAAPATSPTPVAPADGPAGGDLIQSILEQELEAPRNGYTYQPAGRRDPFISLAKPVAGDIADRPKPPGIAGFLLQETSLKGLVKNNDGWIAVLEGP